MSHSANKQCDLLKGEKFDVLAYLESAPLCVKRELVKAHGTDEGDVGGLAVQHLTGCSVDPEPGQLRQHIYHLNV